MEGSSYAIPATYVGGSQNYDIAVLKVTSNAILKNAIEKGVATAVEFADSSAIYAGQTSIAIGNPKQKEYRLLAELSVSIPNISK